MYKLLLSKIKESATSIMPITMIVMFLSFTPFFDMTVFETITFLISSIVLILGMGLFNLGATLAMIPMGEYAGVGLLKKQKLSLLLSVTFIMGLLVTIAEPDLIVLAKQVAGVVDKTTLISCVGVGVGIFLVIAILKMVTHKQLTQILMTFYMLAFALVAIMHEQGNSYFLPLAFDSGGVTTGPITVPFIMAFGVGVASSLGGRDINENSFGMVSLSSIGPILVVLLLLMFSSGTMNYKTPIYSIEQYSSAGASTITYIVLTEFAMCLKDVSRALLMIFVFFIVLQVSLLRLPKTKMIQIFLGIFITLFGLAIFLTTVNVAFLPIGQSLGFQLAKVDKKVVICIAFVIGMTVVLAEPAVHVLNEQVEEVTAGAVTKRSMLVALSIGVGVAMTLALIRVIFGFSLIYYLVPGYFLALVLSLFVPPIYTSIAFDSGGVASGPMSSTFILPLVIGFCTNYVGEEYVLSLAFGIISLIAMTPLITIQFLGFNAVAKNYVKNKISMKRILTADDNQIIYFSRV